MSSGRIRIKDARAIRAMRTAGEIVALVLDELSRTAAPGVTTLDLDHLAERLIRRHGAKPSFKNYRGFPASICASVNHEVVHGIPNERPLKAGDIVGLDVGALIDGYHADGAYTVGLFPLAPETGNLLRATQEAMWRGIDQARAGHRVSAISRAVQSYAEACGYGVVRELVGHGVGKDLHEGPEIPNYVDPSRIDDPVLRPGMTVCIEPMINRGGPGTAQLPDNWTIVTSDLEPSAHFEHTVLVTEGDPEPLTLLPKGVSGNPFWMRDGHASRPGAEERARGEAVSSA
jgi:methionyl aminopeptidase